MRLPLRTAPTSAEADAYARAPKPSKRTPWRQVSYCVVDLELTGLDPAVDEIISFGAVPVTDGRVRAQDAVYGLVRPARPPREDTVVVHGIRPLDLVDAPPLPEAILPLLAAMTGRVLVVHAAEVERAFLGPALRAAGVRLHEPVLDTRVLGRMWLHERDGQAPRWLSLAALTVALGLPSHRPHHALGDALTTAQAFIALATHLNRVHEQTVKSLAQAGEHLQALRLFTQR